MTWRWVLALTILFQGIFQSSPARADPLRCVVWKRLAGGAVGAGLLTQQEQAMVDEIERLFQRLYKTEEGPDAPRLYEEPETLSTAISWAQHEREMAHFKRQWDAIDPDLRRYFAKLKYDEAWRDTIFLHSYSQHELSNTTGRLTRQAKFHDYRVNLGVAILDALLLLRRMDRVQATAANNEAVLADLKLKFEGARERLAKIHFEFYNLSLDALNADLTVQRLTLVQQRAIAWDWLAQVFPSGGWRNLETYTDPIRHWRTYVNPIRRWAFITYVLVWKTQYYRWANASFFSKFITPVMVTMATPLIISSFQMVAGGKFDNSMLGVILEAIRHMFSMQ